MSTRSSSGVPARKLRSLTAAAVAAGALGLMPAGASAAASDLEVVVAKTATSQPGVPSVLNLRLKNKGTEAYDPASPALASETEVRWEIPAEWPPLATTVRSAHGWDCTTTWGNRGTCRLEHPVPAGGASLPIEVETVPTSRGESESFGYDALISGDVLTAGTGGGKPSSVPFPVTGAPVDSSRNEPGVVPIEFKDSGLADHPRDPKVAGAADRTELTGAEQATVTFAASSGGTISSGPFNPFIRSRSFTGSAAQYPNVQIGITLPAGQVVVDDIAVFGLLPEQVSEDLSMPAAADGSLAASPGFGEVPVDPAKIEGNPATGEYLITLPAGTRLLTDHPVRVAAKVHFKDGVDSAELLAEVSAPSGLESVATAAGAGRALLAGESPATTKITLSRKPAPVIPTTPVTPTTPTTPTPEQPAPTPTPAQPADQGAVLAERVAPRLTGKATFSKPRIRVGRNTNLTVNVTNEGNGSSNAGKVCVKLSRALVVVKLPRGVSVEGAKLCAKTASLRPDGTALAASGIVVRGVQATPSATVRDGADDGVAVVGDRLQVLAAPSRGGGVTG